MAAEPLRRFVRALGWDVVRYPNPTGSLGPHLLILFEQARTDCVLDVGAHWGEYGAMLRESGYGGEIVSFEPVAASAARLQERCSGDPRWSAKQVALGSTDGTTEIHVSHDSDLSSFHVISSYGRELFPDATVIDTTETVEVRRLDTILGECVEQFRTRRFFLKMDTQGWDLEVLSGARGCLDLIFGLQSEISVRSIYDGMPSYTESLTRLQDAGFAVTGIFPVQRDNQLRVVEFDCVMTRDD